ncbi:type III PLP-dependent enzyme domain-containing protein [Pulveribacter suum]|uniref:hypothetical protein n=1 Tax=Pulveribacter suum TaxID=2116657 RepID=UPI0022203F1E|nr:hypothetical protein [Pulveribacter suum]
MVQSVSEAGQALLTCGRHDLSYDLEMPIPVSLARRGALVAKAVPGHWSVSALNDQHASLCLNGEAPPAQQPRVGDRVELGLSHPCTTFDKWRWMPVV